MAEGSRSTLPGATAGASLRPVAELLAAAASDTDLADALCHAARVLVGADVAWLLLGRSADIAGSSAGDPETHHHRLPPPPIPVRPRDDRAARVEAATVTAATSPWRGLLATVAIPGQQGSDDLLIVGRTAGHAGFDTGHLQSLDDLAETVPLLFRAARRAPVGSGPASRSGEPSTTDRPADRFWDVVESAPDAMMMVDPTGRLTLVNRSAEQLFGYRRAELIGQPIELLIPERHRTAHVDHRDDYRLAPSARPMGVGSDLWARHADGSEFPVEISLSPATAPGDEGHVIAAVRDIRSRSETEDRLREAEIRFHGAFDAGPVPMALVDLTDPSDRSIIEANQAMADLLGYPLDELIGMSFVDLTHQDDRPKDDKAANALVAGELGRYSTAKRYLRADGSTIWVQLHASPLLRRDGGVLGIAHVIDITEQIRAFAAAEQREALDHAISEIRLAMLRGASRDQGLTLVARSAAECLDADATLLLTDAAAGPGIEVTCEGDDSGGSDTVLGIAATHGIDHVEQHPLIACAKDTVMEVRRSGRAQICDPLDHPELRRHPAFADASTAPSIVVAPLADGSGAVGALLVLRSTSATPYEPSDLAPIEAFASEAVIAIELAAVAEAHQRLELLEDRDRIGRDMHDKVIGRLFGTGMNLQALASLVDGNARERALAAVDEIDSTIQEIRATIYGVRSQIDWGKGIRGEILELAAGQRESLGFEPSVELRGDIDDLPRHLADDLLAATREALSNTAKYANATRAEIIVTAAAGRLTLTVIDNGAGFDQAADTGRPDSGSLTRHGLDNLATRAEQHGGELQITSAPDQGTTIDWRVPIDQPADPRT